MDRLLGLDGVFLSLTSVSHSNEQRGIGSPRMGQILTSDPIRDGAAFGTFPSAGRLLTSRASSFLGYDVKK